MNKNLSSVVVEKCQVCGSVHLEPILFLGYLPPVNNMNKIGDKPKEEASYPAQLLYCKDCHLVQIGLIVDPKVIFPSQYPYTSSTTKVLRDNFAELYEESHSILKINSQDLVIDIGSNDGNLLSNFMGKCRVLGITPEDIGNIAIKRGIPTVIDYFNEKVSKKVVEDHGKARIITATNVFAHIDDVNKVVELILQMLQPKGVFVSESHYLLPLIETLQYDTIYHEHLRYYSLRSLKFLFDRHGLEIFHAKQIPTHGGSVRVYAARKGDYEAKATVDQLLQKEEKIVSGTKNLYDFKEKVVLSKLQLQSMLCDIKKAGKKIYGISAPSRASTLINYVGLDDGTIDCVLEVEGSYKIGKYIPGTLIPVVEESVLFKDQPDYALLFSWHIADELIPKLKNKGFNGKFIVPLPEPKIV